MWRSYLPLLWACLLVLVLVRLRHVVRVSYWLLTPLLCVLRLQQVFPNVRYVVLYYTVSLALSTAPLFRSVLRSRLLPRQCCALRYRAVRSCCILLLRTPWSLCLPRGRAGPVRLLVHLHGPWLFARLLSMCACRLSSIGARLASCVRSLCSSYASRLCITSLPSICVRVVSLWIQPACNQLCCTYSRPMCLVLSCVY
jgi:hypothetical protein